MPSFSVTSLRSPFIRLKWKMSLKQVSPTRQNAVCNFVWSSCIFSLLMHSSVGVNWSILILHQTTQNQDKPQSAITDTAVTTTKRTLSFGIWKYCETDVTGAVIGCDKLGNLLGVPKQRYTLMPDWLILSWVFIFGALVISIMAVVTAFSAIFVNALVNLFWCIIFYGFVTFFTFSLIILYIFKEIDSQKLANVDDGGDVSVEVTFTERYGKEFYFVLLAGVMSFTHLTRTCLRIKNVEKFVVFY